MEDVRAVAMALYARLFIQRGVAVAADMEAILHDRDRHHHNRGDAHGNANAPNACADNIYFNISPHYTFLMIIIHIYLEI